MIKGYKKYKIYILVILLITVMVAVIHLSSETGAILEHSNVDNVVPTSFVTTDNKSESVDNDNIQVKAKSKNKLASIFDAEVTFDIKSDAEVNVIGTAISNISSESDKDVASDIDIQNSGDQKKDAQSNLQLYLTQIKYMQMMVMQILQKTDYSESLAKIDQDLLPQDIKNIMQKITLYKDEHRAFLAPAVQIFPRGSDSRAIDDLMKYIIKVEEIPVKTAERIKGYEEIVHMIPILMDYLSSEEFFTKVMHHA